MPDGIAKKGFKLQMVQREIVSARSRRPVAAGLAIWLVCGRPALGVTSAEFHQTLSVSPSEMVSLDVDLPAGELQICYGREGQVSISAIAKASRLVHEEDAVSPLVKVEQNGNHVTIRPPAQTDYRSKMVYRIDVPYRTELTSKLGIGQQNITGLLGPVNAVTDKGGVAIAYISKSVQARVNVGDVNIQSVGDHVDAETSVGNIYGERLPRGVQAKTGNGDIILMVVGSSSAVVEKGNGRIDVGGARGTLRGSTDSGDLHVKAVPHEDWSLSSVTGNVRLELPPNASFQLDVSTTRGQLRSDLSDSLLSDVTPPGFHQSFNGGGKRISVHTESGTIALR
jgi:hypothetical protein